MPQVDNGRIGKRQIAVLSALIAAIGVIAAAVWYGVAQPAIEAERADCSTRVEELSEAHRESILYLKELIESAEGSR